MINTLQSDYSEQVEIIDSIKNDMKQIVKNDNMNSKQITELEQSEGTEFSFLTGRIFNL